MQIAQPGCRKVSKSFVVYEALCLVVFAANQIILLQENLQETLLGILQKNHFHSVPLKITRLLKALYRDRQIISKTPLLVLSCEQGSPNEMEDFYWKYMKTSWQIEAN